MKIDPRRVSAAWPVLSILTAVALLTGFLIGSPIYRRVQLQTSLNQAARMYQIGYASHIALTDFTEFEWTEVHIFSPYTPIERIEAAIGTGWPAFASKRIESDDGISLLVFMGGDRIARWVEINRSVADYTDVADGSPFTPETAVFIMPVEGEPRMVKLKK